MIEVIGVKFRNVGKVYYFDPNGFEIHYHDHVIVETARGIEYGLVVLTPVPVADEKVPQPLKPVIRMATAEDGEHEKINRAKEKEAYHICKSKILEHGLDMKLIEAEYTFDDTKVLFYFTAEGRIDFRELVKDLAGIFRTRIELRQIGVRDETKLLGGMGTCGRPLCCHTWLNEFAPVSIKMAKDQNLSLNPTKISGTCGRLMCCLKNEADTYASLNKGLPGKGDYVTTPEGMHGDVQSVNILRQTVKVIVELENDEKELREYEVKDITFVPKSKKPKAQANQNGKEKDEPKDAAKENSREVKKAKKAQREEKEEIPEFIEKADLNVIIEEEETLIGQQQSQGRRRRRGKGPKEGKETVPAAVNDETAASEMRPEEAENREGHEEKHRSRNRRSRNRGGNGENAAAAPKKTKPDQTDVQPTASAAHHSEKPEEHKEGGDSERKPRRRRRRPHHGPRPEGAPQQNEGGNHDGE